MDYYMGKLNQHNGYYSRIRSHNSAASTPCVSCTLPQLLNNQLIKNCQLLIVEDGNCEPAVFHRWSREFENSGRKWVEKLSTSFQYNYERVIDKVINIQTGENARAH